MNELEQIKSQLTQINNTRIKLQTLSEQAKAKCAEIEQKYNVSNLEEMQALVNQAQVEYQQQVLEAQQYINSANEVLKNYSGVI